MLNFGLWSSSKGMVKVPNLSTLTMEEAVPLLESIGLFSAIISTPVTTNDQSLNNKIAYQSISAETLVSYETVISIQSYSYVVTPTPVAPTPVPTPAPTPVPTPTPVAQNCSGIYYVYGEPRCGGYASIYNTCGVFLGCND
jgi:hypothetical protein